MSIDIRKLLDLLVPGGLGIAMLALIPSQTGNSVMLLAGDAGDARLFPTVVAWGLLLVTAYRVVALFRERRASGKEASGARPLRFGSASFWAGTGLLAGYALVLPYAGFLASTLPLVAAMSWLIGARRPIRVLIYSVAVALAIDLAFVKLLKIPLPEGFFGL